jgi:hypothetical protein
MSGYKAYKDAMTLAYQEYEETVAPIRKEYYEVCQSTYKVYKEKEALAVKAYRVAGGRSFTAGRPLGPHDWAGALADRDILEGYHNDN